MIRIQTLQICICTILPYLNGKFLSNERNCGDVCSDMHPSQPCNAALLHSHGVYKMPRSACNAHFDVMVIAVSKTHVQRLAWDPSWETAYKGCHFHFSASSEISSSTISNNSTTFIYSIQFYSLAMAYQDVKGFKMACDNVEGILFTVQ
jgi:hypothetical protein